MSNRGIITVSEGDFTLLKYIGALDSTDLERTVGFERGRLDSGFLIVALAESEALSPEDFILAASSRWSCGAIKHTAQGQAIGIEEILSERGQDVAALKQKVAKFFARRGGNTPAKILPNRRHTAKDRYPDAEALGPGLRSGVPQFTLVNPKRFVIIRDEK